MTTSTSPEAAEQLGKDWWRTALIDMSPGVIRYRGYAIEELITERVSFASMIWLLTRGELPTPSQAELLDMALMSAVDHGPQAPSVAIARMAATCGVGLNSAMASGVNVLGDIHGGAGEQALELFNQVKVECEQGHALSEVVHKVLQDHLHTGGKIIPGFGHRFHPIDPRCRPMLERLQAMATQGAISGRFVEIARGVEDELARLKGRHIPMNIDGATAVVYGELGFEPALARGLFCVSRSVGLLAHAWEQSQSNERIKGPLPRAWTPTYDGPAPRAVPKQGAADGPSTPSKDFS